MNKTVKNTAIYFAGTVIMGIVGFVNTMLLTRMLDEQVYAMYGLLSTFVTAATTFITFGYDSAYSRFYYKHGYTQKIFILRTLRTPVLVFLVFSLILLEPNRFLLNYVFEDRLSLITVLLLLAYILFAFLQRFTQLTARMEERALNYVASNFVGKFGFVSIVAVLFFVWHKVEFDWVVISFLISSAVATAMNVLVFARLKNHQNKEGELISEKELFSYGFPYMMNNFLILVIPVIEKVIIRDLAGWEVLGIFTAASVFQTVVLIVVNTLDNIWNPLVYKHYHNATVFKPIMHTLGVVATLIISLGLSACILLRRWLVLLLDSSYHSVYIIAPTVMFGAFFNIIALIYGVGINISKKTLHYVISPILQLVASILLCYLVIPKLGLIGVGLATSAGIVVSRMYRVIVGLHYYDAGASELKNGFVYLLCAGASVASMFFTSFFADVIMSLSLIILTLVLFSKEFKPLLKDAKKLLKKE